MFGENKVEYGLVQMARATSCRAPVFPQKERDLGLGNTNSTRSGPGTAQC